MNELDRMTAERDAWRRSFERVNETVMDAEERYAERIIDALGQDQNDFDIEGWTEDVIRAVKAQTADLAALEPVVRALLAHQRAPMEGAPDLWDAVELAIDDLPADLKAELEAGHADRG